MGTARQRRHAWLVFIALTLGPGAFLTYLWSGSIAWANFQSWLALVIAALTGYSAETPVEEENGENQTDQTSQAISAGAFRDEEARGNQSETEDRSNEA